MTESFRSLLPPNSTKLERSTEKLMAKSSDLPVPIRDLWNPDACPLPLLPWLAWSLGVTKWDSKWSEEQKRACVRNALFVKRYKGTYQAVERALGSLGYTIRIIEWFADAPRRDEFTFRIEVAITDTGIDEPMYTSMEDLIDDAKNLRSHMTGIRLITRSDATAYIGTAVTSGEVTKIFPAPNEITTEAASAIFTYRWKTMSRVAPSDATDFTLVGTLPREKNSPSSSMAPISRTVKGPTSPGMTISRMKVSSCPAMRKTAFTLVRYTSRTRLVCVAEAVTALPPPSPTAMWVILSCSSIITLADSLARPIAVGMEK